MSEAAQKEEAPPAQTGMSFADAFNLAVRFFNEKRLSEAAEVAQAILRIHPANPDTLHLAGVIAHARGDAALAVELIGKALGGRRTAAFMNNFANALQIGRASCRERV